MDNIEINLVRQKPGSKTCTLCCVSMLKSVSTAELLSWFGTDRTSKGEKYWSLSRAWQALSHETGRQWRGLSFEFDVPDRFNELCLGDDFDVMDHVALVGVMSKETRLPSGKLAEHCVIYDPSIRRIIDPAQPESCHMDDYEFTYWEPLTLMLPYDGEKL